MRARGEVRDWGGPLACRVAGDEVGHAGGDAVAVAERWRGAEEGLCRLLAPARRGLGVRRDAWIHGHGFSSLTILPQNRFCNVPTHWSAAVRSVFSDPCRSSRPPPSPSRPRAPHGQGPSLLCLYSGRRARGRRLAKSQVSPSAPPCAGSAGDAAGGLVRP